MRVDLFNRTIQNWKMFLRYQWLYPSIFISTIFTSSCVAAAKISYDTSMMLVALCKVNYKLMGFTFNVLFSRWDSNSTWNMRKIIDRQKPRQLTIYEIFKMAIFKKRPLSLLWLANLNQNFQFRKWQLSFHCWATTLPPPVYPSKLLLVQFGYRLSHLAKRSKFWLKGVIPRASIYVISVAINGWAIFIIFLGSLFNEIKSTRTKIFRQIFANKRGGRVRLVEFDVIWSKILLPSKLWNGSHTLWLDCWFLTFYQNFEHIIFWCWVQYLLR